MKLLLILAILTPLEVNENEILFNTMWAEEENVSQDIGFDEQTKTFYARKIK